MSEFPLAISTETIVKIETDVVALDLNFASFLQDYILLDIKIHPLVKTC